MTYYVIINGTENQIQRESEQSEDGQMWILKKFLGHNKNGQQWDVLIKWGDDREIWELLSTIWSSDLVTLDKYARDNDLLNIDVWKCMWYYSRNKNNLARLMRQVRLNSMNNVPRIKFDVSILRNHAEAVEFDSKN